MTGPITTAGTVSRQGSPEGAPAHRERLCGASEFPVVERCTYLSICDSTVLSNRVRHAVDEFLDHVMYWRETRAVREYRVDGARDKFARLVGASATDIAIVKNVSEGINAIATAIPWRAGDNVVLCASLEHPNNVLPWVHLRRLGVEMRVVEPVEGAIEPDAIIAAIDGRTRVVTCSSVTFAPGLRTDLGAIGRACRSRDVLFLVDAVQSAGILSIDVSSDQIDALVTSTAKGLLGMYGCGFLYCRREWAERLTPTYLSRPAVELPPERYSEMGSLDVTMRGDARRFEVGAVDYASCYAVDASLALLGDIGVPAIEAHVLALAGRLRTGMVDLGLDVPSRAFGSEASHIVTVGRLGAGGHGTATDPLLASLSEHLNAHNVVHTIRRGMLRFAFHLFNSDEDVNRVLGLAREVVSRTGA
ncbi:MAG: aminotransferase class V-fold PLP-dependent enzyme [Rhodospirillales bacterium]|nr:aminotransferase class V-fold PLP-dependent enzyme [Rhodospirillales bacterium]